MSEVTIRDDAQAGRFEAVVDGEVAGFADYSLDEGTDPSVLVLPHTVVDDAYGGRGVGGALARHALDQARSRGWGVRPTCPFIAGWIEKHPDYEDLVVD